MVVGIGGAYCSGKSTVAGILVEAGYLEINVDELGHEALSQCRDQVVAAFGEAFLRTDGTVDRRALGSRVFADPDARNRLEAIVHPVMVRTATEMISAAGNTPVAMHAALLYHMKLDRLCDMILWVRAPFFARLRRGLVRDGGNIVRILRIMWTQRKLGPQPGNKTADTHSVMNRGNRDALMTQLRRLRLPGI